MRALRPLSLSLALSLVVALVAVLVSPLARAAPPQPQPLVDVQVIALPGVVRRIDHLAVDAPGKRLFVAALGNGTLEVLDVGAGTRITSVGGLKEPQGVAYLARQHRVVVAMRADRSRPSTIRAGSARRRSRAWATPTT